MTNPNRQRLKVPALLGVLLLAGFGMVCLTGSFAQTTNGYNGFPLDDPWIHLQFAKNVVEYGSFSYYEDQLVTAGSTSPLYTLLLAAGMLVTRDEMLLSYTLGTIFFLIGGWFFFALIRRQFGEQLLVAVLAVFLFLMEPRLQWVTLSGMETTLFISNVLAAVYFYYVKKPVAFGIVSGLLMWSRPEGLLMLMVFGADFFYHHVIVRDASAAADPPLSRLRRSWVLRALPILAALVLAYGAFNLALSGTFLPNTYAAKLKYYAAGGEGFLPQVFHFLSDGHMVIPALFALIGTMSVLLTTIRREANPFLIPLLWAGGMVVAYWWKLPYLYHNGRYLMPILPFVLIIAFHGISAIADLATKIARTIPRERIERTLQAGMLGIAAIQFVIGSWTGRDVYADYCRYIHDRQVTTAFWIRDHLPEDAVVATHDIGAVAYYSGRRIVDMVGLVSPEIISRIGEREALLDHLNRSGATHLAVLRSWFDIDNINPLFQTDEMRPEVMEVFRYDPERMHFIEGSLSHSIEAASFGLLAGDIQGAGFALEQAVRKDPRSSRAHLLLGDAYLAYGETERAEQAFRTTLALHPDSWKAIQGLAEVELKREKPHAAVAILERLIQLNPEYAPAYRALAQTYYRNKFDWSKGERYLTTYRRLTDQAAPAGD